MDCYKNFAHIYDELINVDINYKKWSDEIIKICEAEGISKDSYLDLACGTGNLTEEIGLYFKKVWAVDLSYDMLMEAEGKLRKKGIKANFVHQDLSKLKLNRKFDLITCCLDSTNYLLNDSDIISYLKGVSELLNDNGLFIFDINSYYKLSEILGNNIFTYDDEEVFYSWENEFEDGVVNMYLTFFIRDGQVYKRFDENHQERAYKEEDVEKFLDEAKLKVVKKLNNYEYKKIDEKTERIVYIIKKA
ncbi:class I SAM-dependent methyltransferase [Haloimpatiens sp. FM7315]|uniref:class I SAM-dependent DNA methyltransferase n=1 Tax=Haloimpatiens sp. FM7315 TaxID=3298609 RepID=UPI0035A34738